VVSFAYRGTMYVLRLFALALIALTMSSEKAVAAGGYSPETLIVQRLQHWADAFNNRDTSRICDLFSVSLIATTPDAPNRLRSQVCENLDRMLAQTDRRLRYDSTIHEVIVSGNVAIVRLDWTLRVTKNHRVTTTLEHGMDVFRHEHGTWSIVRFLAFSDTPKEAVKF
jgi:ketosteroid isomerase-like protein